MHKSFLPLFVISLLGVLGTSIFPHDQSLYHWIGLLIGVLPLIVYHILLSREPSLSSVEIDSIYYYGFLITVITLVSTAISIALETNKFDIHWILLQFGLGLIATGYALFSRLLLLTKSSNKIEVDVVEASKQLVISVTEVTEKFNEAGFQATALVDLFKENITNIIENGGNQFEKGITESVSTYTIAIDSFTSNTINKCEATITKATDDICFAVSKLIVEIERVNTELENLSFNNVSGRINEFSTSVESSLQSIVEKTEEVGVSASLGISELVSTTRKVQKLAIDIAVKLEKLEQIKDFQETLINTTSAFNTLNVSVDQVSTEILNIALKSNHILENINTFVKPVSTNEFSSGFKALSESISKLKQSFDDIDYQSSGLKHSLKSFDNSTASNLKGINELNSVINELKSNLDGVSTILSTINQSAQAKPKVKWWFQK